MIESFKNNYESVKENNKRKKRAKRLSKLNSARINVTPLPEQHHLGTFDYLCEHCNAM